MIGKSNGGTGTENPRVGGSIPSLGTTQAENTGDFQPRSATDPTERADPQSNSSPGMGGLCWACGKMMGAGACPVCGR